MAQDDPFESAKWVAAKLAKRTAKLTSLIEGPLHPSLRASVQRAAATLEVCADLLAELRTAVEARTVQEAERIQRAQRPGNAFTPFTEVTGTLTWLVLRQETEPLIDAIQLIADERDAEALKALGKEALNLLLKVAAVLSGAELAKVIYEFIQAGMDLLQLGRSMRFRKNQVKLASELLLWLDSVAMIALTWGVRAQSVILKAEGTFATTSNDEIVERVIERIRVRALPRE